MIVVILVTRKAQSELLFNKPASGLSSLMWSHSISVLHPSLMFASAGVQWGSMICKHSARWLHLSRLKSNAVYSFRKTYNVNKTRQVKPGKGARIW